MTSLAGDAWGTLCPRWRPSLDRPLFGAFGAYGMDGTPAPCSKMTAQVAKWTSGTQQGEFLEASLVQGEIGILTTPETQRGTFLLSRFEAKDSYAQAVTGAYRRFFGLGYQPDFVHIDDLGRHQNTYLPIPVMLDRSTADRIAEWIEGGGVLFSERHPGYLGGSCHAGTVQPNLRLDQVFGVRELNVELIQDILQDEPVLWEGRLFYGGEYIQSYSLVGASRLISGGNDQVFTSESRWGSGTAFLMGTSLGTRYSSHPWEEQKKIFKWITERMGLETHVVCGNPKVRIRIQTNGESLFLWLINGDHSVQNTDVSFHGRFTCGGIEKIYWREDSISVFNGIVRVEIEGRNAIIVELEEKKYVKNRGN